MIDADLILRPLAETEDAVRQLTEYDTPEALTGALEQVWDALERTLRRLLRADTAAPDALRLAAFSPAELPVDSLVEALRARELISLELAGLIHQSTQAVQRARTGQVRAADADAARRAVVRLRAEVHALGERPVREAARHTAATHALAEDAQPVRPPAPRDRSFAWWAAGVAVLLLIGLAVVLVLSLEHAMDAAVEAFDAGRLDAAEQRFRSVVEDDPANVTARLYLARIYRREGEHERAAAQLQAALREDSDDPDVRRELGHLLLQLNRPEAAVQQYRRAVELEPEQSLAWLGLIRALRAADDPRADEMLRRAPADVRAVLATEADTAQPATPATMDPGSP